MPTPKKRDEGKLLVASADFKGVPLIKDEVAKVAAFETAKKNPGSRPLILLMDGQECLWETAATHLGDRDRVEILDFIHVSTYVWEASALFQNTREHREAFARERLLKILNGDISGVVRGLRRMGTLAKLKGEKLTSLQRICGYLEKHKDRMH